MKNLKKYILQPITDYWVTIWKDYFKNTQRNIIFFWICALQIWLKFSILKISDWLFDRSTIVSLLILLSFFIFLYKWIKIKNTRVIFNDKNVVIDTISLNKKWINEIQYNLVYKDINNIKVKKNWLWFIIILILLVICMFWNLESAWGFLKTIFDRILYIVLVLIIFFRRNKYCTIHIQLNSGKTYESKTIRAKAKLINEKLSQYINKDLKQNIEIL